MHSEDIRYTYTGCTPPKPCYDILFTSAHLYRSYLACMSLRVTVQCSGRMTHQYTADRTDIA